MRARRRMSLGALLLAFAGLQACGQRAPTTQPSQATLSVVTWNIHGCRGGLDAVAAGLQRLNGDIVCLQEAESDSPQARGFSEAERIAERLAMRCVSAGSALDEGGKQEMAILSRLDLHDVVPLDAGTGRT
jgi:endonuclease/exonuclease/phosphatase family metal-dependent hydrolase